MKAIIHQLSYDYGLVMTDCPAYPDAFPPGPGSDKLILDIELQSPPAWIGGAPQILLAAAGVSPVPEEVSASLKKIEASRASHSDRDRRLAHAGVFSVPRSMICSNAAFSQD